MANNRFLNIKLLLVAVAALFMGCGNSAVSASAGVESRDVSKLTFALPKIPMTIRGMESRSQYLAEHYWDGFDFADQRLMKSDSLMSIALSGYIQVLSMNANAPEIVERSVDISLGRALKSGYDQFDLLTSKLEDCLYDPNSPMRNEELYIYVLRYTVDKAPLEDVYKIRSRSQLEMVLKNQVGKRALDFAVESREGRVLSLYGVKSKYTILFFNTPDCEDCTRVKEFIGRSSLLKKMVKSGTLTIVGVYPEENIPLWRKANYPSIIVNSADTKGDISRKKLYDLKALPTLYLLDVDKKVLLKDRTIEEIKGVLERLQVGGL